MVDSEEENIGLRAFEELRKSVEYSDQTNKQVFSALYDYSRWIKQVYFRLWAASD